MPTDFFLPSRPLRLFFAACASHVLTSIMRSEQLLLFFLFVPFVIFVINRPVNSHGSGRSLPFDYVPELRS